MQALKIKVSKQKVNGGVLACRRVTVREKLLRFLLGTPIKLTVLVPGDTVSDSLAIGNAYAKPVRLFFRIEGETDNALAKQVKLKIRAGEIQIFHGTLSDAMKEIYLAYMTPNWSSVLTYELEVPAELKNAFALQDCGQKWIFRAEVNPVKNLIPNTADPDDLKFYAAGFAVSLLAAAIAFTHLRRDRGAL